MAVEFVAASTQRISCGSAAGVDNINPRSIMFLIKADDISDHMYIVIKGTAGTNTGWALSLVDQPGSSDYVWRLYEGWSVAYGYWTTDNAFTYGQKYHVAVSYNSGSTGNNPIFYVDGAVESNTEGQAPNGAHGSDAAKTLNIGVHDDLSSFPADCLLEDFRILNRIVTPDEVKQVAAGYRLPLGGEVFWPDMMRAHGIAHWDGTALVVNTNYLPDGSVNDNVCNPVNNPVARASDFLRMGVAL